MKIRMIPFMAAIILVAFSCSKENTKDQSSNQRSDQKYLSAEITYCGTTSVQPLLAGKTIDAGSVTVGNDLANFYITINTTGDWTISESHLYLSSSEPMSKGAPGLYLYNSYSTGINSLGTAVTYIVPLTDVEDFQCGDIAWLMVHAVVQRTVNGVVQSETAMAGTIYPNAKPWYGKFSYTVQCGCEDHVENCTYETGFGGATVGAGSAWWYAFDTQGAATQAIYAGQAITDGTVTYDGTKLIINLGSWKLQDVPESVKVEGYNTLPTKRPAAGKFTLYTGTNLTVPTNGSRYYVIHLDVQKCE